MESTFCIDQDVKEDEYDAFNDETFGDGGGDDAWEESHDVLAAQLEENIKKQQHNARHIEGIVNTSISQLGLDEEVRNFAPHLPATDLPQRTSGYSMPLVGGLPTPVPLQSPPMALPPPLLPDKVLSMMPISQPRPLRSPLPAQVVRAEQLERQILQETRRRQVPMPPPPQVKTLEELESEMLLRQQQLKQQPQASPVQEEHLYPQIPQSHQQHLLQQQQQQQQLYHQQQQQHLQHHPQVQHPQMNAKPSNQEVHLNQPTSLPHIEPPVPAHYGYRQLRSRPGGHFGHYPQNFGHERYPDYHNVPAPISNSPAMNPRFRFSHPHPNQFQRGPDYRDQRFADAPKDYRRDDGRYSDQRNQRNNSQPANDYYERAGFRCDKLDVETFGFDAVYEHRQEQETKSLARGRSDDPFVGLMSNKEKDFVIRVQMLSLNMQCPQEQDYYYLEYMKRKSQGKAGGRNELLTQRIQRMQDKPHEPQQFENSLGKLHSSTAHAPKKILDMAGSRKLDDGDGRTVPANTDLLLFRKLLMDTEKGFSLLLKIEDPEVLTCYEDKLQAADDLLNKLGFSPEHLLAIRKGRLLLMRTIGALWRLGGYRESCIQLLCSLFDNLELILLRQKGLGDAVFMEKFDIISGVLKECSSAEIERLQKCMRKYETSAQWILAGDLGQMIIEKLREAASRT